MTEAEKILVYKKRTYVKTTKKLFLGKSLKLGAINTDELFTWKWLKW